MSVLDQREARLQERDAVPKFSRREKELLRYLVDGFSNQEIADAFGRSVKTAEATFNNASKKLANALGPVRSRVKIAMWVTRHPWAAGLPEDPLQANLIAFVTDYLKARHAADAAKLKELDDRGQTLLAEVRR